MSAPDRDASSCRLYGLSEAQTKDQADLAIALHSAFSDEESLVLIEPGLPSGRNRPPDLVLVHRRLGVHVFEIKGVELDRVLGIEPGFAVRIDYGDRVYSQNPISQAKNAVFDIKGAVEQRILTNVRTPICAWALWPRILRERWCDRFASEMGWPDDWLFAEALRGRQWIDRLSDVWRRRMADHGLDRIPDAEWEGVCLSFGDSAVLSPRRGDRAGRRVTESTLGWFFDRRASGYMELSDEQHDLVTQDWATGPRLVRGVAGSGKSVVLASHLARRLKRMLGEGEVLFERDRRGPRILAVCFNRTLAPFLRDRIEVAYRQRTGQEVPKGCVTVAHLNNVMYDLFRKGLTAYIPVGELPEAQRARKYLDAMRECAATGGEVLRSIAFDAVYVDEGQDFLEDEFAALAMLCRQTHEGGEPSLFVFYDDAQNLYGRPRPNWTGMGLRMVGRSFVMTEGFRNTRSIVEPAFNVLLGTVSGSDRVSSRGFTDINYLEQRGAVARRASGTYAALFARRQDGFPPRVHRCTTVEQEDAWIVRRVGHLLGEQEVRAQDILVLTCHRYRAEQVARRLASAFGEARIHLATQTKDEPIGVSDRVTVSTVASAKGLDAYVVLLASAHDFEGDLVGRVSFYVGCTRARELLEISCARRSKLLDEFEAALKEIEMPTVS